MVIDFIKYRNLEIKIQGAIKEHYKSLCITNQDMEYKDNKLTIKPMSDIKAKKFSSILWEKYRLMKKNHKSDELDVSFTPLKTRNILKSRSTYLDRALYSKSEVWNEKY